MEVNNILIQPEAWDFNKAKLGNPDLKDRLDSNAPKDKHPEDVEGEGTNLTLSAKGLALSRSSESVKIPDILAKKSEDDPKAKDLPPLESAPISEEAKSGKNSSPGVGILSMAERKDIDKLRLRDLEVRADVQAHLASAGRYSSGGVNYEYKKGPDGRSYVTKGDVNIVIPEGKTPEENLRIAIQVERAASSSVKPSEADRIVSSEARRLAALARKEILENAIRRGSDEFVILGGGTPQIEASKKVGKLVEIPNSIAADAYIVNSNYNSKVEDRNTDSIDESISTPTKK